MMDNASNNDKMTEALSNCMSLFLYSYRNANNVFRSAV